MKKALLAAAAIVALPMIAQAQSPSPGLYIGAEGGVNWLLNFTASPNNPALPPVNVRPKTGWMAGGVIGYDFVGPRVELDVIYRNNCLQRQHLPGTALNSQVGQLGFMVNLLYDFFPTSVITPYIGAGAGIGLHRQQLSLGSTQFASGIRPWLERRQQLPLNLEGRYFGTTNPTVNGQKWTNNNFAHARLQLQVRPSPPPPPPPPPPVAPPSFMVFFDWDRSNLSPAGPEHDQAGRRRVQEQGQRAHHGDRPHRHVGPGSLQHGAVAASCEHGQGRAGA